MNLTHMSLIAVSIDLIAGVGKLKKIVSDFGQIGEVTGISSIYKRYLNRRSEDLNSELVFVFKFETERLQEEIFEFLKLHEQHVQGTDSVTLSLLVYDQQVRLFPGQNLPSPLLHSDPLALRCAAEVWGSYEHPVLGQTLNELVRSNQPLSRVEFFAQGRSLFSPE